MKRRRPFFCLILIIHFFAWATAANTHAASDQNEISKDKLSVDEVTVAEVTVENSYGTRLNNSAEEAPNSEISSPPSKEESPEIKITDTPAEA